MGARSRRLAVSGRAISAVASGATRAREHGCNEAGVSRNASNLGGRRMSRSGTALIIFAWSMEVVGVTAGVINSAYTTFGENFPTTFAGYVPAVPMAALAVAELGRVPLASVIYSKHTFMQGMAVLGILALGYLAVENWTFGFERIVDLRLKPVNTVSRELSRAEAELAALRQQRTQHAESNGARRDELRRGIEQRDASIAELTAQLGKEADVHQKNLEGIREACRIIRDKCMVPRSQAEDSRYEQEVGRLSNDLARQRDARKQLQAQIDALVSSDAESVAALDLAIVAASEAVTAARVAFRQAADGNQIYRLAASWFRVSTADVTAEQFAAARWVFTSFSAVAVALAGSIAGLVYYSGTRAPGAPSFTGRLMAKLVRARRAYYARLRKPLKVEVPGGERVVYRDGKEPPVVIEKEKIVERWRDQIVLIPRWGIKFPIHINSLIGRGGQGSGAEPKNDGAANPNSNFNVTPLKKAN
jgi:hypothetical protein